MEDNGVFWVVAVPSAAGLFRPQHPCSGWLARLNFYRAAAGLPPVTENPVLESESQPPDSLLNKMGN